MQFVFFFFKRCIKYWDAILYIFHSIYFNFHYLPFKQAVKLPILLYHPHFVCLKGKVLLDSSIISFGMITLGFNKVPLYPNTGITWENAGLCVFKGKCCIGNASAISIGKTGEIYFGNNFIANAQFRICSFYSIVFKENVLVGWDNIFTDTDFHYVINKETKQLNRPYGPILICSNNWFGMKCCIYKRAVTPDYAIISANSVINKEICSDNYILLAGNPVSVVKKGVYRDHYKDLDLEYLKE